jgi:hypothetical protein
MSTHAPLLSKRERKWQRWFFVAIVILLGALLSTFLTETKTDNDQLKEPRLGPAAQGTGGSIPTPSDADSATYPSGDSAARDRQRP